MQDKSGPDEFDVVIVGRGPVGATLANLLGLCGLRTLVLEREARTYLERVIGVANDVGLLSEMWDMRGNRLLGNFPQALSHLALINTALGLCGPVLQRGGG